MGYRHNAPTDNLACKGFKKNTLEKKKKPWKTIPISNTL